jgi:pimeloyl-ACP methyl ester carboxylesterase
MRIAKSLVLMAILAVTAQAQQTPVMLVHGFVSNPGTWDQTIWYLSSLPDAPFALRTAQLSYLGGLSGQRDELVNQLNLYDLGPNAILVGHSQGGLVSRLASGSVPVKAVVSIGSPHLGTPAANPGKFFQKTAELAIPWGGMMAFAEAVPTTYEYWDFWDAITYATEGFALTSMGVAIGTTAVANWTTPYFIEQLRTGLPQMTDGEQSPYRVSIQVALDMGYNAGPLRLQHDGPTSVQMGNDLFWHGVMMFHWGFMITYSAFDDEAPDGTPLYYQTQRACAGSFMMDLAWEVSHLAQWWSLDVLETEEHDGIVPTASQIMPNSTLVLRHPTGMSHVEETSRGAAQIESVLRNIPPGPQ